EDEHGEREEQDVAALVAEPVTEPLESHGVLAPQLLALEADGLYLFPGHIHAAVGRLTAENQGPEVDGVGFDPGAIGEHDGGGIPEMPVHVVGRQRAVRRIAREGEARDAREWDLPLASPTPDGDVVGLAMTLPRLRATLEVALQGSDRTG